MVRAFYKTGFGLAGCYLDDSQGCAQEFNRRKDLANAIRDEIAFYNMPKACFREVGIVKLWQAITHAKSASSYSFHIHHKANVLNFYGLTEREYLEDRASSECADDKDRQALIDYDNN